MHNELIDVGLRGVRRRVALLVIAAGFVGVLIATAAMFDPHWPLDDAVAGGWRTVVIGALVGGGTMVLLMLVGEHRAVRRAWPTVAISPAPSLTSTVESLAIGLGVATPRVWQFESTVPNVADLPGPHGQHLVVSTTAIAGLSPLELEAVMAW